MLFKMTLVSLFLGSCVWAVSSPEYRFDGHVEPVSFKNNRPVAWRFVVEMPVTGNLNTKEIGSGAWGEATGSLTELSPKKWVFKLKSFKPEGAK